jgi:trehalose 6-phosphate phosphatase
MNGQVSPPVPPPGTTALVLDLDATFVAVPPDTAAGVVRPERIHLLARLHDRLDGALALLSGRTVDELDDLLAPLNLTLLAVHGLDRRLDDGSRVRAEPDAALRAARATFGAFALARDGVRFEDKGVAVALHARPEAVAAARAVAERALAAADGRLALRAADGTVELLPAGHDEAGALAGLAAEPPFRGRRPVVVSGGDGAAAGLRAVQARGGMGVVVGSALPQGVSGWTLARVTDLEDWLERWLSR